MTILFASVYIGDYLVLTDTLDSSWRASFATLNCTNSTKQECQKCHPGSFANQSTCISYSLIVILDLPLKLFLVQPAIKTHSCICAFICMKAELCT